MNETFKIIRDAWDRGCPFADLVDEAAADDSQEGRWWRIEHSSLSAVDKMLARALFWMAMPELGREAVEFVKLWRGWRNFALERKAEGKTPFGGAAMAELEEKADAILARVA